MRHSSKSVSLLLAIGGIFLATAAIAGGHKTVMPMVTIDVSPEVESAVTAVVHETANRWNSQDFSSVLELWDQNDPFPTYLAEEQAQWFVGWDRLRAYLDPPVPNPIIEVLREEMSKIQVKQIAPDLAIAIWEMHFEMKVRGSNPIGEDVRVSAVLRNTPEGWRYIHWVESPKATMVYIEDLFEKGVAEGWDEYYKAAMQRKKEVWQSKRQQ